MVIYHVRSIRQHFTLGGSPCDPGLRQRQPVLRETPISISQKIYWMPPATSVLPESSGVPARVAAGRDAVGVIVAIPGFLNVKLPFRTILLCAVFPAMCGKRRFQGAFLVLRESFVLFIGRADMLLGHGRDIITRDFRCIQELPFYQDGDQTRWRLCGRRASG